MVYTITEFRKNHRKAFTEASQGKPILITRHDETFRLVLDGGNSSKASVGVKPKATSALPCPHGRQPTNGVDGWRHCPHCLGINERSPMPLEKPE